MTDKPRYRTMLEQAPALVEEQLINGMHASFRGVHFARWPVEGAPPVFASVDDYERRVEDLLATGAIVDRGQLYWHARLSEHAPTVEVRVADVQLDADSAVVVAGLVRALGHAVLTGNPPDGGRTMPVELLRAATWVAARHGLDSELVDPRSRTTLPERMALHGIGPMPAGESTAGTRKGRSDA